MDTTNLNNLRERMHTYTHAHSFQNKEFSDEHFFDVELSDEYLLMLVITELADAVEADRENKRSNYTRFKAAVNFQAITIDEMWKEAFEAYIKNTVEDELADAVIRLLDLAGLQGLEIDFPEKWIDGRRSACVGKSFTENIYDICNIHCKRTLLHGETIGHSVKHMIASILGLAEYLDVDLAWHIDQKMKYNEFRPKMHGKKY